MFKFCIKQLFFNQNPNGKLSLHLQLFLTNVF